jgi:hypothetical protein
VFDPDGLEESRLRVNLMRQVAICDDQSGSLLTPEVNRIS